MKPGTLRSAAVTTVAALALAGCAELPPGETSGPFTNENAAAAAGDITRAASTAHSESLAGGSTVGAAVSATVVVIAKHEATPRQRQVATKRARAVVRRMAAQQQKADASRTTASRDEKPTKRDTATGTKQKKKMPRYIAVDTEKNEKTSPKAKKAVMIFDTEAEDVVGNSVYDVANTPTVGSTAKFETYAAEYVGSGPGI